MRTSGGLRIWWKGRFGDGPYIADRQPFFSDKTVGNGRACYLLYMYYRCTIYCTQYGMHLNRHRTVDVFQTECVIWTGLTHSLVIGIILYRQICHTSFLLCQSETRSLSLMKNLSFGALLLSKYSLIPYDIMVRIMVMTFPFSTIHRGLFAQAFYHNPLVLSRCNQKLLSPFGT